MSDFALPLIESNVTLQDAYRTLLGEKRSAIAVRSGERIGIITAPQIIREAKNGKALIEEIDPEEKEIGFSHQNPILKIFSRQARVELVGFEGRFVKIVAPAATRTLWMQGPSICQCDNPQTPHGGYLPSDDNTRCGRCPHTVHCLPLD
jgi:hypothetical protein